jgi:hypothetical protein
MSADVVVEDAVVAGDPLAEAKESRSEARSGDTVLVQRISLAALAAAIVPLVVAAVRAIRDGWVPVGDVAISVIRTRDVLGGGELPLLGMWSAQSWSGDVDFNHPGPLFYDLLAVPARLFPGGGGMVAGAIAVSILSTIGLHLGGRRLGGPLVGLATTLMAASLAWSMGSAALVEPWHPNTLLLPFLLFLVLVWAVAAGDLPCLPWAAAIGSLLLESNLAFVILVPVLLLFVTGKAFLDHRGKGTRLRRIGLITAVVLVVLWAQPLAEQLFGPGQGNLSRIRASTGNSYYTMNWRDSIRSVAKVVALPPWGSGNGSFSDSFRFGAFGNPLPSLGLSILALAVGAVALAGCWWLARRHDDQVAAWALVLAFVVVGLALVNANLTPSGDLGVVDYRMKWLWPVASFAVLAFVVFDARRFSTTPRRATWYAAALGLSTAVVAALTLGPTDGGAYAPPGTLPVARAVASDLDEEHLAGPLLVRCDEGVIGPYCEAVLAELQHEGTSFVVDEGIGVRQLGEERRWTGHNATAGLLVVEGDHVVLQPPENEPVVVHPGLDEEEQLELFNLRAELVEAADQGDITLNERGMRVARRGDLLGVEVRGSSVDIDGELLVESRDGLFGSTRELVAMVGEDLIDLDGPLGADLRRYADLQTRWDLETVGVFLTPIDAAEAEG